MTIEARNLSLVRDGRTILSGIDLSARAGEVTALIGPNGCGKTTLLSALTGTMRPGEGHVLLDGVDISRLSPRMLAQRRAVLAQDTQVAFSFTVAEVLHLGFEAGGYPPDPAVMRQLLADVDLAGMADRPYHALSGGERQRVHLARTIAQVRPAPADGCPKWLFLDEPVSSLDIGHQLMVMRRARRFAQDGGGVVVVLHDLNLTAMVADHVLLIAEGAILAAGPPSAVLTDANLSRAYRCPIRRNRAPEGGIFVLPQMAGDHLVRS